MSDLFDNIRKNIMTNMAPLQNAFKIRANFFIDSFLEDNDINKDIYSDDFESESDDDVNNRNASDNYNAVTDCSNDPLINIFLLDMPANLSTSNNVSDKNSVAVQQPNKKKIKVWRVPKQQSFNDKIDNLKKTVYSPIECNDSIVNIKSLFDVECGNNDNDNDNHTVNITVNHVENTNNTVIDDGNTNTNVNGNQVEIPIIKDSNEQTTNLCSDIINNNCPTSNYIFSDELLINNLTVLTKIEKNQKLNIIYDNTINNKLNFQINIDESYFPQLSRWYYSQSRNCTIDSIDSLTNYTIEQYNYYKSINDEERAQKYIDLLDKTNNGLLNLKFTYETDDETTNKINKIKEKITKFINEQRIINDKN
jgi:hypothetical protein